MEIEIQNIAGIRSGETTVQEGVNVVQASNFKGKSSFMTALRVGAGATGIYDEPTPLTEGEEAGSVVVDIDGQKHEVNLSAEGRQVSIDGEPYIADEVDQVCARLFAFLDEQNPIRKAVRNGEDLTEYLQKPLDIQDIDAQIGKKQSEKRELKDKISEIQESKEKAQEAEAKINRLTSELEDLRSKKEELEEQIEEEEATSEAENELSDRRGTLNTIERKIDSLENRQSTKESALEDKQQELEDITVPPEPDEDEIEEKQARINVISEQIDLLEDLRDANENILNQGEVELVSDINRSIGGDTVECWVCGTESKKEEIENKVAEIKTNLKPLRREKEELNGEVADLRKNKRNRERAKSKQEELRSDVSKIENDLSDIRVDLENKKRKKEELQQEIEELQSEVEEEEGAYGELSEKITNVKAEIKTKEDVVADERQKKERSEENIEPVEPIKESVKELSDEINTLQEKKTDKQMQLKDEFNRSLDEIIDSFAPGFDGGRLDVITDEKTGDVVRFDLNVVRDGKEIPIENLSEGERELVGVIVTSAGYRTFEVGERTPLIMIDGISQLAAMNLNGLVDFLKDKAEYLVTTAYPEAGDIGEFKISPEEWNVVSSDRSGQIAGD
jgi:DNA repair exonuclease SbcCD ATPase subunit